MIFKCKACELVFGVPVMIPVTNCAVPYLKPSDKGERVSDIRDGLCPGCALETILRIDMDDIMHGVRLAKGSGA